jgi:hypothetical protein
MTAKAAQRRGEGNSAQGQRQQWQQQLSAREDNGSGSSMRGRATEGRPEKEEWRW